MAQNQLLCLILVPFVVVWLGMVSNLGAKIPNSCLIKKGLG